MTKKILLKQTEPQELHKQLQLWSDPLSVSGGLLRHLGLGCGCSVSTETLSTLRLRSTEIGKRGFASIEGDLTEGVGGLTAIGLGTLRLEQE